MVAAVVGRQVQAQERPAPEPERPFIAYWEDVEGGLRGQPGVRKFETKAEVLRWAESHRDAAEVQLSLTRQAWKREHTHYAIEFYNKLIASISRMKNLSKLEATPLNLAAMLSEYQKQHVKKTPDILMRDPLSKAKRVVEPADLSILEEQQATEGRRGRITQPRAEVAPTVETQDELGDELPLETDEE